MRTFQPPAGTRFDAGVDRHARALFLVVLDTDGQVCFARNLPAAPQPFLRAVDQDVVPANGEVLVGHASPPARHVGRGPP